MGGRLLLDRIRGYRYSSASRSKASSQSGPSSQHAAAATQAISWSDIPTAVLAQALSCLSFEVRAIPASHLLRYTPSTAACTTATQGAGTRVG